MQFYIPTYSILQSFVIHFEHEKIVIASCMKNDGKMIEKKHLKVRHMEVRHIKVIHIEVRHALILNKHQIFK